MEPESSKPSRMSIYRLIGVALVAWLGLVLHTLTHPVLSTPEQVLVVITLFLLVSLTVVLMIRPDQSFARIGLILVAIFHLGIAILTVLPIENFNPLPEQTITHYGIHALYGLAQLPLVAVLYNWHTKANR